MPTHRSRSGEQPAPLKSGTRVRISCNEPRRVGFETPEKHRARVAYHGKSATVRAESQFRFSPNGNERWYIVKIDGNGEVKNYPESKLVRV